MLDDYQSVAARSADWSSLAPHRITFFSRPFEGEDAVAAALQDFEIVVAMRERTPFPATLLSRLPALRLLVTTGRRNASIDVAAAVNRGITVCGTESLAPPPAELTWALILALSRHVPEEDRALREGRWQTTIGRTLQGRTLGVLGLGRLGGEVARVGLAFGMRVIAWSQNLTPERARDVGVEAVEKEVLFREADVLTIHLVLSERTRGLVGASELAWMKPDGLLINTARGPIVDEAALVTALEQGRLGGAGLDVYAHEPLPLDAPLRRAPRTVLTPHLGYVTEESYRLFYRQAVEDIRAWLQGAPLRLLDAG